MLIGLIEVEIYHKLARSALAREFGLNGSLTEVTCQVENIRGENDILAATLALTE